MSTNLWQSPKLALGSVLDSAELQTMDEQIAEANQSLADRVVEHLTQAIISGELRPGARISEPKLAKQLGVSRGPLREATRRLQERMLVTHTPRQGVRVVELSREVLHEVCTIREALEIGRAHV